MLDRFEALREAWWPAMEAMIDDVLTAGSPTGLALAEMTRYHLETGGKRLRAMLPLLVAEALGVERERMLPFGAACEMLHNATLVHDDLQDGDAVRRGRPTVWNRFGVPQAINVGDAMFYWTLMLAGRTDAPAGVRNAVVQRVVVETLRVIDGQAQEFALKAQPITTVDDYLRMVEGKTSGLFALPMAGAAVLCEAEPAVVDALAEAARHLGVLFQVQDDVLDLYGEKGRDKVGNDLREGKRSLLVVHALEVLDPGRAAWLRGVLDAPREETSDEDVAAAIVLLTDCGALDRALDEIVQRRLLARQAVSDDRLVALLDGLAEVLVAPIAPTLRLRDARATAADVAFCQEHLPRVSRTFALSIELLPPGLRDAVRVGYLLCRVLDTIEDDATAPQATRDAMFASFERILDTPGADVSGFAALGATLGANADETALMAGAAAVYRCWWSLDAAQRDVMRPWLVEMGRGMREYTLRREAGGGVLRLRDLDDVERYCGFVAGTVGALLTGLFRLACPSADVPPARVMDVGWRFGLGLQLVNVLKDVAEDAERGVCWLPEDVAARRGVDLGQILDADREAGLAVVREVAARAREHLVAAARYTVA
ncbi:MAG TPA: polyprenyl synthetase family protein, partial [Myxococcota bacterium]|nr:polyprenyl synthetase family protein [Myxococcota bacterium]